MIVGIGLNVNQTAFPADIPNPVSLKELTGNHYELSTLLSSLLTHLDNRYDQLQSGQEIQLSDKYQQRMYRHGDWHQYLIRGKQYEARINGLTSYGQLILENREGAQWRCDLKEVVYL